MAQKMTSRSAVTALLLVLAPALLIGCGRKGAPIKPSDAAIAKAKENKEPVPEKPIPNSENPDKKFVLDGLLD